MGTVVVDDEFFFIQDITVVNSTGGFTATTKSLV